MTQHLRVPPDDAATRVIDLSWMVDPLRTHVARLQRSSEAKDVADLLVAFLDLLEALYEAVGDRHLAADTRILGQFSTLISAGAFANFVLLHGQGREEDAASTFSKVVESTFVLGLLVGANFTRIRGDTP